MQRYKRKKLNLQIEKKFQMWLLVRILGTIFVSSIVAAGILYFYAHQEVGESFYDAHIKIRRVSDLLIPVVIAGSLVSLVSGMLIAIFLPQKIAGPIFRIEQDLIVIRGGDLDKKIRLRDGDPLQGLAESINATIMSVRSRLGHD
ncbi:MAG: methyl-accepting chemotaxis protein [Proteobacteria bacterium]|nr:methyl-accepting chemotaxis protein [Pseudomonadota bacterium]MBU1688457.1 methyl-accepting chemotaxis protein [Pseudomonadota bacterium]